MARKDSPQRVAAKPSSGIGIPWSAYILHQPTPKQLAALLYDGLELLYGGAAGGGKTDYLLAAALQYVDIPEYSALIFRRTLQDAQRSESILDRAFKWLTPCPNVRYESKHSRFTFPSGATLSFGYMPNYSSTSSYQSAEFQFIGWDEVSQIQEECYTYMFSRLRRRACSTHKLDEQGAPIFVPGCPECQIRSSVPLRVRAASNPPKQGDPATDGWLVRRFGIQRVVDKQGNYTFRGSNPNRPFLPARLIDNPYTDQESYARGLQELDPVTRDQLYHGDWSAAHEGRFRRKWAMYYSQNGDYYQLPRRKGISIGPSLNLYTDPNANEPLSISTIHKSKVTIFQTIDPATSIKEGPGDREIWRNKAPSASVISTWGVTNEGDLLWLDCEAYYCEVPELIAHARRSYERHKPIMIGIETGGTNLGFVQLIQTLGLPIKPLVTQGRDKLDRAIPVAVRMESGKVYFPRDNRGHGAQLWLEDAERELFAWTGHPHEPADRVDTLSYAGIVVASEHLITSRYNSNRLIPTVFK